MTREIGEVFEIDGVEVKVKEVEKEHLNCTNCYCFGKRRCVDEGECFPKWRKDKKRVIFVEVKE